MHTNPSSRWTAFAAGMLLAFGTACAARAQMFTVESETDGAGHFTYRFSNTNTTWAWGISDWGAIMMQSHGVESVTAPDGWLASVTNKGMVIFSYTNGVYFIEQEPLVLEIQSRFTNTAEYTTVAEGFFSRGVSAGSAYSNHQDVGGGGFHVFTYTGPCPQPRFIGITSTPEQLVFPVVELAGSSCTVERATSLMGSGWTAVTSLAVTASSTTMVCNAEEPSFTSCYYRLKLTY